MAAKAYWWTDLKDWVFSSQFSSLWMATYANFDQGFPDHSMPCPWKQGDIAWLRLASSGWESLAQHNDAKTSKTTIQGQPKKKWQGDQHMREPKLTLPSKQCHYTNDKTKMNFCWHVPLFSQATTLSLISNSGTVTATLVNWSPLWGSKLPVIEMTIPRTVTSKVSWLSKLRGLSWYFFSYEMWQQNTVGRPGDLSDLSWMQRMMAKAKALLTLSWMNSCVWYQP